MKKNLLKAVIATAGMSMIVTPTLVSAQVNEGVPAGEKPKTAENTDASQARVKPASREEAKVRLDQAKGSVEAAKLTKDQKEKDEAEISKSLVEKNDVKTQVNKKIEKNNAGALGYIEEQKKNAVEEVAKLQKRVDDLDREVIASISNINKVAAKVENAEKVLKEKKAALDTLNEEHQAVIKEISEAKVKLEAAKTEVANKEKEIEANKAAIEKTTAELGENNKQLAKAQADLQSKNKEIATIEQELKDKTNTKNQLEGEYNKAIEELNSENKAVAKDVEAAKAVVQTKTDAVKAAQSDYDAAKQKLDESKDSLKTAKDNVATISSNLEEKTKKLNELNSKINELNGNKDENTNKLNTAEDEKQQLEQSLSEKDESIKALAKKINENKAKLEAAEKELATLKKAREEAKAKADSAVADSAKQLALGAKGFYESVGSINAAKLFDNKTYYETIDGTILKEYKEKYVEAQTHMGQKDDATSIENIEHAIHLLQDSAKLRKNEGLNELKVTDNMMAYAQRNVNWSSYIIGHFGMTDYTEHTPTYADGFNPDTFGFNGSFENLAWGPGGFGTGDPKAAGETGSYSRSPFYGWYFVERNNLWLKEIKDKTDIDRDGIIGPTKGYTSEEIKGKGDAEGQTGHYTNILGKYEFTGMAYREAPGNRYRNCSGQEFMYASYMKHDYTQDPGNKGYTIEEYKARFDNYVNKIKAMPEEAKNIFNAKDAAYNAQVKIINDIKAESTNLTNQQQSKETEKNQLKEKVKAKDGEIAAIKEAAKTIEQKMNTAKSEAAAIEGEKGSLEGNLTAAKKEQTRLDGVVADNNNKLVTAENKINTAKGELEAAKKDLKNKEDAFNKLQKNSGLAERAEKLKTAKAELEKVQNKLDVAKEEKAKIEKAVGTSTSGLEGKLATLKKEQETLETALANLKEKVSNAQSTYNNLIAKNANVAAAKDDLDKAQNALDEAKAELDQTKEAKDTLERNMDEAVAELNKAKEKKAKADKLLWNGDQTAEVADNDFKELNQYIKAAKDSKEELETAEKEIAEITKNHETAKAELEKANKAYNRALAELAIAQTDYDSFTPAGTTVETAAPLTGKWHKDSKGNWTFNDDKTGKVKDKYAMIKGNTYKFDSKGVMTTGWSYDKGTWYYFSKKGEGTEGAMVKTTWKKIGTSWYYFYENGKMAADTMVGKYYVNKKGAWTKDHWVKSSNGKWWYSLKEGGYLKNAYRYIDGNVYHFDNKGWMTTGWINEEGIWHYLNKKGEGTEGAMVRSAWKKIGTKWYHFIEDGEMAVDTMVGKYYVNKSGAWTWDHWVKSSNGKWWYSFKEGNYPKNTFEYIRGNRYHFDNRGWMTTGWLYNHGDWFYFNKKGEGTEGAMVKDSWKKINGKWYYFDKYGKMAKNTTINGWKVDKLGVWVR